MIPNLKERAGIDRSIICSFGLEAVDMAKLKQATAYSEGEYVLDTTVAERTGLHVPNKNTGELMSIKKLSLTARDIGTLSFEWYSNHLTKKDYPQAKLAINVSNNGNNLQNLNCNEYRERINEVFNTLEHKYGLFINHESVLVKEIELNVSIRLDHDFTEYNNVLNLIRLNLPDRIFGNAKGKVKTGAWCSQDPKAQKSVLETIYVKNSNIELKIYNKVQQLIDTEALPEDAQTDILRIEYKIKDKEKIASIFGSQSIEALRDEAIASLFWKYFNRDIADPWKYWHKANQENLAEVLTRHVNSEERYYLNGFIRECRTYERLNWYPLLFDIEDIRYALSVAKGNRGLNKRFNKVKARLGIETDLTGNIAKIDEIIAKVARACNVNPQEVV